MLRFCLGLFGVLLLVQPGSAHYNMLLPEKAIAEKGEKISFVYQFGHPFEHELFEAPKPAKVEVTFPDGKKTVDLTEKLEKFKKPGVDGKDVTAWRFDFTPEQRGDHWFVLQTPPIWMEEGKEFYQDTVQVLLHVQTQNGWENTPGEGWRLAPLTRPYGLLPGMVFQAESKIVPTSKSSASSGSTGGTAVRKTPTGTVEIERYNPQRPKEIPPDELVTFKTRTDPNCVFTCTLPEAGWWCMTITDVNGTKARNGTDFPVRQRVTLWVHVEAKAAGK
jgi:uncharacterized GH25 family protein